MRLLQSHLSIVPLNFHRTHLKLVHVNHMGRTYVGCTSSRNWALTAQRVIEKRDSRIQTDGECQAAVNACIAVTGGHYALVGNTEPGNYVSEAIQDDEISAQIPSAPPKVAGLRQVEGQRKGLFMSL